MKLSVELCFCQLLPFFVLFATETLAIIHLDNGLTFGEAFQKVYPSYKPPKPKKALCPHEKEKLKKATESSTANPPEALEVNYLIKRFAQRVNHYNLEDNRHFNQRYFVFKGNYIKGNPVFLLVGGVQELEPSYVEEGIWNHFAMESGALLLGLEHRTYGNSVSFWDYSIDNLRFLNSEQALGDLINFVDYIINNNPEGIVITPDTEWIALGSSYGGTLAARLKFKFPHKIKAAVTVNALLLPTVGFEEFYTVLENQCIMYNIDKVISDAFDEFDKGHYRCDENDIGSRQCLQCKYDLFKNKLK